MDLLGGSDLTTPATTQDLSVQKKNTLNANNDNTSTSNNQDFLDLLGLDMPATQLSTTTNLTSNVVSTTNMNNVMGGGGGGGLLGDLSNIISTTSTVPTNGNDLSAIMAAASLNMPSMDLTAVNSLISDPLATTAASNNVSVVSNYWVMFTIVI